MAARGLEGRSQGRRRVRRLRRSAGLRPALLHQLRSARRIVGRPGACGTHRWRQGGEGRRREPDQAARDGLRETLPACVGTLKVPTPVRGRRLGCRWRLASRRPRPRPAFRVWGSPGGRWIVQLPGTGDSGETASEASSEPRAPRSRRGNVPARRPPPSRRPPPEGSTAQAPVHRPPADDPSDNASRRPGRPPPTPAPPPSTPRTASSRHDGSRRATRWPRTTGSWSRSTHRPAGSRTEVSVGLRDLSTGPMPSAPTAGEGTRGEVTSPARSPTAIRWLASTPSRWRALGSVHLPTGARTRAAALINDVSVTATVEPPPGAKAKRRHSSSGRRARATGPGRGIEGASGQAAGRQGHRPLHRAARPARADSVLERRASPSRGHRWARGLEGIVERACSAARSSSFPRTTSGSRARTSSRGPERTSICPARGRQAGRRDGADPRGWDIRPDRGVQ